MGLVFNKELFMFEIYTSTALGSGQNILAQKMAMNVIFCEYHRKYRTISKVQKDFFEFVSSELPTYKTIVHKNQQEVFLKIGSIDQWLPIYSHLFDQIHRDINPYELFVLTCQNFGFDRKGNPVLVIVGYEKRDSFWCDAWEERAS